jgi:hypothetical protein
MILILHHSCQTQLAGTKIRRERVTPRAIASLCTEVSDEDFIHACPTFSVDLSQVLVNDVIAEVGTGPDRNDSYSSRRVSVGVAARGSKVQKILSSLVIVKLLLGPHSLRAGIASMR